MREQDRSEVLRTSYCAHSIDTKPLRPSSLATAEVFAQAWFCHRSNPERWAHSQATAGDEMHQGPTALAGQSHSSCKHHEVLLDRSVPGPSGCIVRLVLWSAQLAVANSMPRQVCPTPLISPFPGRVRVKDSEEELGADGARRRGPLAKRSRPTKKCWRYSPRLILIFFSSFRLNFGWICSWVENWIVLAYTN